MPIKISTITYKLLFLLLIQLGSISFFAQEIKENISKDSLELLGKQYLNEIDFKGESIRNNIATVKKAAPYFKASENWDRYVYSLNWLSFLYYLDKQFESYKQTVLLAYKTGKEKLPKNNASYNDALNNLASYYQFKSYNSKAINTFLESIELIDTSLNNVLILQAVSYHNIGVCYNNLGDKDEAIYYFQKALVLRQKAKLSVDPDIPGILADIALAYKEKNQLDKAIQYYKRSLRHASKIHPKGTYINQTQLFCHQNLADIYLKKGELKKVQTQIFKALKLQEEQSFLKDFYTYEVLGNYTLTQKKYPEALQAFQKGEALAKIAFQNNEKHPELARCLLNMAKVHQAKQDFNLALEYLQKALNRNSLDFNPNTTAELPTESSFLNKVYALEILEQKATCFYQQYLLEKDRFENLEIAYQHYFLATKLIQDIRQNYLAEGSKQTLVEKVKPIYEGAIKVAIEFYEKTHQENYLDQAFAFSEESKASLLLASIQEDFARGFSNIPDTLLQLEQDLSTDISLYEKQIAQIQQNKDQASQEKVKLWTNKIFETREKYKHFVAQLEKEYPQYYELKYEPQIARVKDLQKKLLNNQSLLISYFIGKENNYVFCISSNRIQVHSLVATKLINPNIINLRSILTQSPSTTNFKEDFQDFTSTAHILYNQLLEPVITQTSSDIQQLIIIPDGLLSFIPFEVLLYKKSSPAIFDYDPNTLAYLLNKFHCSYNYSASLCLKNISTPKKNHENLFVGFAPSFDKINASQGHRSCTTEELYALHCNQEEVNLISKILDGQSLLNDQANNQAFNNYANTSQIIHLATHACVDKNQAKQSKIYFSDGDLSVYDFHRMDFSAELLVLSACNTGQGKYLEGEGVLSLSRSFTQAGCPSSLMSLWAIDDCVTKDIMVNFYQYLSQGQKKDQALQNAKLKYLVQTTDKAYAHPFYWAGFAQMGNTKAIDFDRKNTSKYFWLIGIFLLVLLGLFVGTKTSSQRIS